MKIDKNRLYTVAAITLALAVMIPLIIACLSVIRSARTAPTTAAPERATETMATTPTVVAVATEPATVGGEEAAHDFNQLGSRRAGFVMKFDFWVVSGGKEIDRPNRWENTSDDGFVWKDFINGALMGDDGSLVVHARVLKNNLPLHAVAAIAYSQAVGWKEETLDGHEALTWADSYDIEYGINPEAKQYTRHVAAIIKNASTIVILDGVISGKVDDSLTVGMTTWRNALNSIKLNDASISTLPAETKPTVLEKQHFTVSQTSFILSVPPSWRLKESEDWVQFFEPGRSTAVMMVRAANAKAQPEDSRDPLSYHLYELAYTAYHSTIVHINGQTLELSSAKFAPTLDDVDAFADTWPRIVESLRSDEVSH